MGLPAPTPPGGLGQAHPGRVQRRYHRRDTPRAARAGDKPSTGLLHPTSRHRDEISGADGARDMVRMEGPQKMDACYVDGERVKPQPGGFYGGWITNDIVGPFKGEPGTEGW